MNKQEFQERTGFNVPDETFEQINSMYMNAGESIDKDAFCKDYKKHADSVLLNAFNDRIVALQRERNKLTKEKNHTALTLIQEAAKHESKTLRKLAIELLGPNTYLREKICLGIAFDADDYELVTEYL